MPGLSRIFAFVLLPCWLALQGMAQAAPGAPPIDMGAISEEEDEPVAVDKHPDVMPDTVFGIAIDGKTTFAQAMDKLGAAIVHTAGKADGGPRYVCYRSTRGRPAVVAIFTSHAAANPDVIDGFGFGMQSAVPGATKLCRQVPWLKAADLRFDKAWLDMPREKLALPHRPAAAGGKEKAVVQEKTSVLWKAPQKSTPSDATGFAAGRTAGVTAVFEDSKLVFLRAYDSLAPR
ncbi:MAG TPA: hypothetical protein VFV71_12115 [Burkholderiales bacterium]|nr:hypothetical protein [Burkholderiales bacterium]